MGRPTGGVGMPLLAGNVAAKVIVVNPGRVLMRIVHANQLTENIVE